MFYLIALLVCGISFSPFFLQKLDMWHAQGIFAQGIILLMFSWMFFDKPKQITRNVPLALLHTWIGGLTLYICYLTQIHGKYDIQHFFPYFNFLCILILYKATHYLTKQQIHKIVWYLKYVVIITLFICVLQRFNYSQFFKFLVPPEGVYSHLNNLVVGFIGNGTHLSGILASSVPIFVYFGKREDWLALILLGLVLMYTGTSVGDPSISGFVIALCLLIYTLKKDFWKMTVLCGVLAVLIPLGIKHMPQNFLMGSGRFPLWQYYLKVIKTVSLTGGGLGAMNVMYEKTPFPHFRHMHMEYLQYWLEIGLIGLALLANVVVEFFKKKADTRLEVCLKGCVLGFLISGFFNYPSHLWLPSVWAMFFYGSFMAINERN